MAARFSVCVFCGSRFGVEPSHRELARRFGEEVARRGWRLVYGGGDVGLMGVVAGAAVAAGGEVLGIIPRRLMLREVGKRDLAELVVTETMAERKERMIAASDAFVCLPGGLGTLDELLEVMTLKQLGYVAQPVVLIDEGYWRPFVDLVHHSIACGFADPVEPPLFEVVANLDSTMTMLARAAGGG